MNENYLIPLLRFKLVGGREREREKETEREREREKRRTNVKSQKGMTESVY
jgi:hypothetical protein